MPPQQWAKLMQEQQDENLSSNRISWRQLPTFTLQRQRKQQKSKNTWQQLCVGRRMQKARLRDWSRNHYYNRGQKVQKTVQQVSERSRYAYKVSCSSKILNLGRALTVLQAGPVHNAMFHGASVCTCYELIGEQAMDREVKHVLTRH